MTEQNNNDQNQSMPEAAPEPMGTVQQPAAEQAPGAEFGAERTAEIPVDPTAEMPSIAGGTVEPVGDAEQPEDAETVKGAHAAVEANDVREPWYRKVGRSAGATAGVAVGALLVVGLTAGLSAFAGAQAGTFDRGHDRHALEQRITQEDKGDATQQTPDNDADRGNDLDRNDGYGNGGRGDGYGFDGRGDGYGHDSRGNGYGYGNGSDDRGYYGDRHHSRPGDSTDGNKNNQSTPDGQSAPDPQTAPDGQAAPDNQGTPDNQAAPDANQETPDAQTAPA